MQLEVNTLLVVNVANVTILATALPFIMGQQLSHGAANARNALIAQALGWMAMIASGYWPESWTDRLLSTLSMSLWTWANWRMFLALRAWLGQRPWQRAMEVLTWLTPLGYFLVFDSYAVRVGWSNFLLATQMLILLVATRKPLTEQTGHWRLMVAVTLGVIAFTTVGRGVLGAFFTESYPHFTAPHPFNQAAMLAANVALVILNVTFLVAWREEAELQLRSLAISDPLTGLYNRRGWTELASTHLAHSQRHGHSLIVLAMDLDLFKHINDAHGHAVGDLALKLFAKVLSEGKRKGEVVARVGGEEFLVLLPGADEVQARVFDQRVRQTLLDESVKSLGFVVNFSTGLATLTSEHQTLDTLSAQADEALYRAKTSGRGKLSV